MGRLSRIGPNYERVFARGDLDRSKVARRSSPQILQRVQSDAAKSKEEARTVGTALQ